MCIQSVLINGIKYTINGLWIISQFLFVFVGELLLRPASSESRMVGNKCEIESVVSEELVESISLGLRPFS